MHHLFEEPWGEDIRKYNRLKKDVCTTEYNTVNFVIYITTPSTSNFDL